MGAHDEIYTYRDKTAEQVRKTWASAQEEALHEFGHNPYSGSIVTMPGRPRFLDKRFETEDEAYEYILDHHEKREPALAVSFEFGGKVGWCIGGWAAE